MMAFLVFLTLSFFFFSLEVTLFPSLDLLLSLLPLGY